MHRLPQQAQYGLLVSYGFALLYTAFSFPAGYACDRFPRTRLLLGAALDLQQHVHEGQVRAVAEERLRVARRARARRDERRQTVDGVEPGPREVTKMDSPLWKLEKVLRAVNKDIEVVPRGRRVDYSGGSFKDFTDHDRFLIDHDRSRSIKNRS